MPSTRSRQGCEECRRRRRKCDEQKPCCGQCSGFNRTCKYPLRLIWGNCRDQKTANVGQGMLQANQHALETGKVDSNPCLLLSLTKIRQCRKFSDTPPKRYRKTSLGFYASKSSKWGTLTSKVSKADDILRPRYSCFSFMPPIHTRRPP